jgi:pyruvate formate lyase activating enzyme
MDSGIIFKTKKYALHDGPGIRTTVFLKGCPLACRWCHNPEGQAREPQILKAADHQAGKDEMAGRCATVDEIIREIEKDIVFYDESGGGATFSGGEPLLQPQFLFALLRQCRKREIHTAVDTTAFSDQEVFRQLIELADLILFDLKLMDDAAHIKFTGVSNRPILQNLNIAAHAETPLQVRVPIIPEITDTKENVSAIAQYLKALPRLKKIDMLPFHNTAAKKYERLGRANLMEGILPPTQAHMAEIKAGFESSGFDVNIGG